MKFKYWRAGDIIISGEEGDGLMFELHPPVTSTTSRDLILSLKPIVTLAQTQLKGNEEEKKLDKFCLATEPLFHDMMALMVCII